MTEHYFKAECALTDREIGDVLNFMLIHTADVSLAVKEGEQLLEAEKGWTDPGKWERDTQW